MARQTQKEKVLKYLRKYNSITSLTMEEELSIVSPSSVISALRKLGYEIKTTWTFQIDRYGNRHTIGNYILLAITSKPEKSRASPYVLKKLTGRSRGL
jgi:hypothetical protein